MNICTIIAKNYLAHARVLAESFKEHHPDEECYVLIVDNYEGYVEPGSEPFEIVSPSALGIEDYEHMAAMYDVTELSTAVKPWFLEHLLNGRGLERVAYFDPDIRVYDRLDQVDHLTREHELVLIPHVTSPIPRDGEKPSEADILIAGTYNLGFIALERGPRASALLEWWSERLKTDCIIAPDLGYFVDQRWIDMIHGVMPGFGVLSDPGYNVAYWNLHGRNLTLEDGRHRVNGKPLRFFHFSGYDPRRRDRLSKHQSRIPLEEGSALASVCNGYADALLARGYDEVRGWPYDYGALPNGVGFDPLMRRLYREGADAGQVKGRVFTPEGADAFVARLKQPAPSGGGHGVTRYLYELHESRIDLRRAFPNLDGPDGARFAAWAGVPGHVEPFWRPATAGGNEASGAAPSSGGSFGLNVAGYFRSELGVGEVARQMTAALETQNIPTATIGIAAAQSRQGHAYETSRVRPTFPVNLVCVNADALPNFATRAGAKLFENRYSIGMWWWEVSTFPERFAAAFEHVDEVWVGSQHVADAVSPVSPVPVVKVKMPVSVPETKEFYRWELGMPRGFVFLFIFDYHSVFERKNPLSAVNAFEKAFPPGSGASLVLKSINGDRYPEKHAKLVAASQDHPDIHVIDRYVSVDEKNAMIANCDCYVSLHRSEGFGITLAEAMYLGKPVIATAYSGNLDFMTERNGYLVDYELRPIGEGHAPYPAGGEWAAPDVDHAATLMRHVFEYGEESRERGTLAAADIRRTHSLQAAGRVMAERLELLKARRPQRPSPADNQDDRARPVQATSVSANQPREEARPESEHPESAPRIRSTQSEMGEATLHTDQDEVGSHDDQPEPSHQPSPVVGTGHLRLKIAHTPAPAVSRRPLVGRIANLARGVALKLTWPFAMQQRDINTQLLDTIEKLQEDMQEDVRNLTALHTALQSRTQSVARLAAAQRNLHQVVRKVQARNAHLYKVIKRVQARNADMAGALNQQKEDVLRRDSALGARLDTLEGLRAASSRMLEQQDARLGKLEEGRRLLSADEREDMRGFEERNADVLGAVGQHEERLTALEGAEAEEVEALRARVEGIGGTLKKLVSRVESLYPHIEAADDLVAESRALPYVSGTPFEVFEEPEAGRVQGYVAASGNGNAANGLYDAFEDIFRGSEQFIRERQRCYLDFLKDHGPVLDAGCGRGELLDILRETGIDYAGVDLDPGMVERCRAKGHERVEAADANSYLENLEDGSLGVVFSAQMIEHLPYEELMRFFALGLRKLRSGGLFIAETVNPHSSAALKAFWVDLTHQQPIFPETTLALCKIHGFASAYVFHPNGSGDVEKDRYETGEYAVVATKAATQPDQDAPQ